MQYPSRHLLWMIVAISPTFGRYFAFVGTVILFRLPAGKWAFAIQCRVPQPKIDRQCASISIRIAGDLSQNKYIDQWFPHCWRKFVWLSIFNSLTSIGRQVASRVSMVLMVGKGIVGLKDENVSEYDMVALCFSSSVRTEGEEIFKCFPLRSRFQSNVFNLGHPCITGLSCWWHHVSLLMSKPSCANLLNRVLLSKQLQSNSRPLL